VTKRELPVSLYRRVPDSQSVSNQAKHSTSNLIFLEQQSDGNRERAAAILGISSRTLYRKLREYETGGTPAGLATES
jgi:DNA-binding NtrC family response regulator